MEKRVRKILSRGKVQGTDDLSGVEKAELGDQEHAKKKGKLVITSFFCRRCFDFMCTGFFCRRRSFAITYERDGC